MCMCYCDPSEPDKQVANTNDTAIRSACICVFRTRPNAIADCFTKRDCRRRRCTRHDVKISNRITVSVAKYAYDKLFTHRHTCIYIVRLCRSLLCLKIKNNPSVISNRVIKSGKNAFNEFCTNENYGRSSLERRLCCFLIINVVRFISIYMRLDNDDSWGVHHTYIYVYQRARR